MTTVRALVGALGLAGAVYGLVELLDLGWHNLENAGIWLLGGVVVHDAVLAPLAIVCGVLVTRLWFRIPAAVVVGAVVIVTVTATAVPVLGRFGARADNATLLDRNYLLGWLGLVTLTVVVVTLSMASRTRKGGADGTRAGGR